VASAEYVFSPMIGASTLSNELASVFRSPSDRDRVYVASMSTAAPLRAELEVAIPRPSVARQLPLDGRSDAVQRVDAKSS